MRDLKLFLSIGMSVLFLSGCADGIPPKTDPAYAPTMPKMPPRLEPQNGTIYQAPTALTLFEDRKAKRIGDILTIVLNENFNASKEAKTEMKKDNSTSVPNPTVLGTTPQFDTPKILPIVNHKDNNLNFSMQSNHDFKGDGKSEQNDSLTGTISVTVSDVLPNGNLVVRGEKWIGINQGEEFIRLTGIVRPDDVSPDNTISSLQVADAKITYSGKGQVNDSNVQGWLSRFFTTKWWPF